MKWLKRWRGRHLYCAAFGLLLVGCAAIRTNSAATSPQLGSLTGTLTLTAPETANVGAAVPVTVGPIAAPAGTTVALTAVGSYGTYFFQTSLENNLARFVLPPNLTGASGVVTLVTTAGEARGEGKLTLLPGPPVEPLVPLVGPDSIVANGIDSSMVVVVPFDSLGNPVAEGTPISVRSLHPGDRREEQRISVRNLLAWTRIRSGTRAGQTTIAVQADTAYGPEATVREVAGWPVPFRLSAKPRSLPANGQDLITLRTNVIRDRFGNVMPDGTLVTFIVEVPGNTLDHIPAYTIGGQAEAPVQAPLQPGIATVRALVYNVESESLDITFTAGPAVGTFPVVATVDAENGAVRVTAGPLLAQLGQYVPDGTPVRFSVVGGGGQKQELAGVSKDGYSTVELRLAMLPRDTYTITASTGSGQGSTTFTISKDED